jgi:hypothetical protein
MFIHGGFSTRNSIMLFGFGGLQPQIRGNLDVSLVVQLGHS